MSPLFLLVVSVLTPIQASFDPVRGRNVHVIQEAIPTKTVSALCYDAEGLLMVGTSGGLGRYDGDRFENFLAADFPGLDSDRILALHSDPSGKIWVGSDQAAPSYYDDDHFHRLCSLNELHSVKQFYRGSDEELWLAGNRLGRIRDDVLDLFGPDQGLPDGEIRRVTEDGDGVLWMATNLGVFREEGSRFVRVDDRSSNYVLMDFDGYVWSQVTETGDLTPLNGPPARPIPLGIARIRDECPVGSAAKYIATTEGVRQLVREEGTGARLRIEFPVIGRKESIERRPASCLLPCHGRDLWIGTDLDGLNYVESRFVRVVELSNELPARPVYHLHPLPDGKALVTEEILELGFILGPDDERTPVTITDYRDYHSFVTATADGVTYVGTRAGLSTLEDGRLIPDRRDLGSVETIVATESGSVWITADGQLQQISAPDKSQEEHQSYPLPPRGITTMCAIGETLYLASPGQLLRLEPEAQDWVLIADTENAAVRQLRPGPSGEIWISTYGSGLWRLHPEGRLDRWSRSDGLSDPFLAWIAPIDRSDDLWVSSNSGVIRISIRSLDAQAAGDVHSIEARSFSAPEANGPRGAVLSNGSFALPTVEGIALFDPAAVSQPEAPPRVLLRGPYVDGAPYVEGSHPHGRANLRYAFTAPIFPTASRVSFQYRMMELDDRWMDTGSAREVRFPSLPSGQYTLEVRARTPESAWSAPARSMTLEIAPYWYNRTWVRWLLAGMAAFIVQRLIALRTRTLVGSNDALREEMAQRKSAEARLRSSERRFRRLFHTAPSAILSWTPSGVLLDRNERADSLFGWGLDEVIEGEPWELFADQELGKDVVHRAFIDCEDFSLVAMTKVGDVQTRRCRWHFAPTRAETGEVTSIIAMISDLSRRDRDAQTLAQLRESLVRAEEAERSRIARELHDDLSQRLAALALEAHLIDLGETDSTPGAGQPIESFKHEIEDVAIHLHTLSRQLHPTIVDDLGLMSALRSECSRRNKSEGPPIVLNVSNEVEEPPKDTALGLFRIAQEAIRNASRHSGANLIEVSLGTDGDWLELSVSDNGKGIDSDTAPGSSGIGMNSMRERARLAGGDLFVKSKPGGGTKIKARVPRHPDAIRREMARREG